MHFVGPDQLHGFEERLTTDIYPADVDWTPDWSRPLDQPLPWYHTMESVLAPGICAAAMQTDYDEEVTFQATRKLYEIARHRAEQPFFLFVSFTNPHDPWEIPARCWDRYRREDIDGPTVPALALDEVDPHSRRLRAMCQVDEAGADRRPRSAAPAMGTTPRSATSTSASARCSARCGTPGCRTAPRCCSAPITERCSASGASGTRCRSWSSPPGCRSWWRRPAGPAGASGRRAGVAGRLRPDGARARRPRCRRHRRSRRRRQPGAGTGRAAAPDHPVVSEYHAEGVQAPSAMIRSGAHKLIVSLEDPDLLYDLACGSAGAPRPLRRPRQWPRCRRPAPGARGPARSARHRRAGAGQPAGAPARLGGAAAGPADLVGLPARVRRRPPVHPQPRGHVRAPAPGPA